MNILFLVLPLLWTALGTAVYGHLFGLSLHTLTQPPTSLQVFGAVWFLLGTVLLAVGVAALTRMSRGHRAVLMDLFTALDHVPGQTPAPTARAAGHTPLELALIYHVTDPFGTRAAARHAEQAQPKL